MRSVHWIEQYFLLEIRQQPPVFTGLNQYTGRFYMNSGTVGIE